MAQIVLMCQVQPAIFAAAEQQTRSGNQQRAGRPHIRVIRTQRSLVVWREIVDRKQSIAAGPQLKDRVAVIRAVRVGIESPVAGHGKNGPGAVRCHAHACLPDCPVAAVWSRIENASLGQGAGIIAKDPAMKNALVCMGAVGQIHHAV